MAPHEAQEGVRRAVDDHPFRTCACFACSLRAARLNAIRCLPLDVLPSGAARAALEMLAAAGCDVRVVASHSDDCGAWGVWLGALADARRDGDGSVPLRLWLVSWRHLCAHAGLTGYVAGLMGVDELGGIGEGEH